MYCIFLKLQTCFKKTNIFGGDCKYCCFEQIVALSPLSGETTFSLELAFPQDSKLHQTATENASWVFIKR